MWDDGSSHDITAIRSLTDQVVSDAYTVTINEAVPENQAPVVPETVSLLATEVALRLRKRSFLIRDVDGDDLHVENLQVQGFEHDGTLIDNGDDT